MNSANNGPYGDAIMRELVPEHRAAVPWASARDMPGSLTVAPPAVGKRWRFRCSIPMEFNGAWIACPDPIDFRAMTAGQHLSGRERVLPGKPLEADPAPGARAIG